MADLTIGDFVVWDSSGGKARGKISSIKNNGTINIPDSSFSVTGTEDDPAALIVVYSKASGEWKPTDTKVGHKLSTLTKIPDLRNVGEIRELPNNYRPALSEDVPEGQACGNCEYYDEDNIDDSGEKAYCTRWNDYVSGAFYCNAWEPHEDDDEMEIELEDDEFRAVNLSAPEFMRSNARRGLKYHEEGLSGDGLKPQTVEDARSMAAGDITEAKWRKIAPWIARHTVDLEAADGEVTAGVVAHLLWGSGSTKAAAARTQQYAERVVAQLEEQRHSSSRITRELFANVRNTMTESNTINWVVREENETRRIAYSDLEIRASEDGTKIVGYAAIFDSPSEPMPFTEYVRSGAFSKTLNDGADVRLLIDHEGIPLARTKSGTLRLEEDDIGLRIETDLDPMNPDAARLISAMKRGDMSQMSFAFRTVKDSWNNDRSIRELKEVQLYDVSVVTFPAYEETVAELRSRISNVTIPPVSNLSLRKNEIAIQRYRSR
jgi:HK97 family phage prohead protease